MHSVHVTSRFNFWRLVASRTTYERGPVTGKYLILTGEMALKQKTQSMMTMMMMMITTKTTTTTTMMMMMMIVMTTTIKMMMTTATTAMTTETMTMMMMMMMMMMVTRFQTNSLFNQYIFSHIINDTLLCKLCGLLFWNEDE